MMVYGCVSRWLTCDVCIGLFWWMLVSGVLLFCPAMSNHVGVTTCRGTGMKFICCCNCFCTRKVLSLNISNNEILH